MKIFVFVIFVVAVYAICGYATQKIMFLGCEKVEKGGRTVTFLGWPFLAITFGILAFLCFLAEVSSDLYCRETATRYTRSRNRTRKRMSMYHGMTATRRRRRRY